MKQRLFPILMTLLLPLLLLATVQPDVIFNHSLHIEDMGTECDACHLGVNSSVSGYDNLLPEMDVCTECHDGDTAGDDCSQCHRNPDDPLVAPRIIDFLPKFPHAPHMAVTDCKGCHAGITASMEAVGDHLPNMALCMNCHATPLTMQGCDLCHQQQDNLLPADHGMDWDLLHAAADKEECEFCHSTDQCEDCHTGTAGEILFHEETYLLTHGLDYRMKGSDCAICHTDNASCRSCHNLSGIKPLWHQELAVDLYESLHAIEAMIDPEYCLVCHGDDPDHDCSKCH